MLQPSPRLVVWANIKFLYFCVGSAGSGGLQVPRSAVPDFSVTRWEFYFGNLQVSVSRVVSLALQLMWPCATEILSS